MEMLAPPALRYAATPANAFEIPTRVQARARRFYAEVFGWKLAATAGDRLRILPAGVEPMVDLATSPRVIDVLDLDVCLARVEGTGGRVVIPKLRLGQLGWMAYCQDCEGNVLCLRQHAGAPAKKRRRRRQYM